LADIGLVFARLIMTEAQVDYFVVHLGGLTIDLFVGFLLFFDVTRPLGVLMCSSFHLMNSQIFSIGQLYVDDDCDSDTVVMMMMMMMMMMMIFVADDEDDDMQILIRMTVMLLMA
jgi:hypothetical protein